MTKRIPTHAIGAFLLLTTNAFAQDLPLNAEVRDTGKLVIANSMSYAPFEYRDEQGNPAGLSIELATALADLLGAELQIEVIPFTNTIPALAAGRVKVGWASFSVTKERLEQVDFVSYMQSGTVAVTSPDRRDEFTDIMSLCGVEVAVSVGSTADLLVDQISGECEAAGREAITKVVYPEMREVIQAVMSNRNPVYLDASTTAAYFETTTNGSLVVASEAFYPTPVGLAVAKGDTETAEMLKAGLQTLMDNGEYRAIYEKYNMLTSAIDTVEVYTDPASVDR